MALSKKLDSLDNWLNYIEDLHSAEIEFGLDRVNEVFVRLFSGKFSCRVITVGGTNGKGSTCGLIEHILLNAGHRCGKHTSPHILNFNERIAINGKDAHDLQLIQAFEQVEKHRKETLLTYFEFTFLAALVVFHEENLDFAICEVGMGGRLDAVNILSPEVSVITNIGLDHMQWLGETRAEIALEKAAISRPYKPCIIGDSDFPINARQYLLDNDVVSLLYGDDYTIETFDDNWQLKVENKTTQGLTFDGNCLQLLPKLVADHQYRNASCAILAVLSLKNIQLEYAHIEAALIHNHLPGRCQILREKPYIIIDVAHNPDSIAALNQFIESSALVLNEESETKTIAVISMLDDKDINNSLKEMKIKIDEWYVAELDVARAASREKIVSAIQASQESAKVYQYEKITAAFEAAKERLKLEDCLLVFGSFFAVSDILRHYQK